MSVSTNEARALFLGLIRRLTVVPVIAVAFFFGSGFMFFDSGLRLRRPGFFPVISFTVAAPLAEEDGWVDLASSAALSWVRAGMAKVGFEYAGQSVTPGPPAPPVLDCSAATKTFFAGTPDTVYATNGNDPDCTAAVCTITFSCGDEIVHASVALNLPLLGGGPASPEGAGALNRVLQHAFGHAAGLDHCGAGEAPAACSARSASDWVDPPPGAVMHRFDDTGVAGMDQDDVMGIQKLYGVFTSQFPADGPYALSGEEVRVMADLEEEQIALAHLPKPTPQETASAIGSVMQHLPASPADIDAETEAWANGGVPAEPRHMSAAEAQAENTRLMESCFSALHARVAAGTDEELRALRLNSSAACAAYTRLKDIVALDARIEGQLVGANLQHWLALRKAVIDEEQRRALD